MANQGRIIFGRLILAVFLIAVFLTAANNYTSDETTLYEIFQSFNVKANLSPLMLDESLSKAAAEYNKYLISSQKRHLYDAVLNSYLDKNFIYDYNMPLAISAAGSVDFKKIINPKLESVLSKENFNSLGVSIINDSEKKKKYIMLIFAKKLVQLDRLPLETQNQLIKISGKMEKKIFEPRLLVVNPDKNIYEYPLEDEQKFFEKTLQLPDRPGKYIFQIVGNDKYGVVSMALFPIYYKVKQSDFDMAYKLDQSDESELLTRKIAEKYLFNKMNELRSNNDRQKLLLNPRLSDMAYKQSVELAENSYFNNSSISSHALIKKNALLENFDLGKFEVNVGVGQYLKGIYDKMLDTPYNLKNMLDPDAQEVGIGVNIVSEFNGLVYYYVTEIFVNKDKIYTNYDLKNQLVEIINSARMNNNLSVLQAQPGFSAQAQEHAEYMAQADALAYVSDTGMHISEKYKKLFGEDNYQVKIYAVEKLEDVISNDLLSMEYNKFAVGLAKGDSKKYGKNVYWIVLVLISDNEK